MKIIRSTKCSLKYVNPRKREILNHILIEYARIVNLFIIQFWAACPSKAGLLKPIVDSVLPSWFSARLRKVAAREAIDMVKGAKKRWKEKAVIPTHRGEQMCVSSTIAELQPSRCSEFDCWLHLQSIGNKVKFDLPIKLHKHFHKWSRKGRRLESYVITQDYIQFSFEIETGLKNPKDSCIGIDTGIKALASLSTGEQIGTDIEVHIERIKRCKHGSNGQRKASRALRQRMAESARQICKVATLVVVENLKGITKNTKRRLVKNMRRSIGRWNVQHWLDRLQMTCEETNVSFRTVSPYKTSQTCHSCGYANRRNRNGEKFLCRKCGYADNADINAARNIFQRFLSGPYGAGCKPLHGHLSIFRETVAERSRRSGTNKVLKKWMTVDAG